LSIATAVNVALSRMKFILAVSFGLLTTGVSYTMSISQYRLSFKAVTLEIKGARDTLGNQGVVKNRKDRSFVFVIAVATFSA